ncbi:terminase small subunit [Tautonia marina]|jgi:phage terminase small subunit|uniref:terminase small subunit n=1 Tax=Tautonia marina TaxID=2653855 RepID=UPI00126118FA|nr:terminase small subunit [Tautonia marina]
MSETLTPKQEKFAQKFVEIDNASESYRFAYDAENMSDEAIAVEACRLRDNPKVALRIEELRKYQLKRHEATADRVIAELARLAFLDIRKAFDEEGNLKPIHELDDDTAAAISGLEVETLFEGKGSEREAVGRLHKIKLSDKKGALDSLAKTLGIAPDKLIVMNQPLPEEDRALLDEYTKAK